MRITVLDKGGVIFLVPERPIRAYRGIARATNPKDSATRRTATDPGRFERYLAGRPNAGRFASYIEGREPLLVCATEIYEVYKVIRRDISEERAVEAVSALRRATIAPVDEPLALEAADLSLTHGLAMADSLVYATARRFGATLVTRDADFEGLADAVVVR
jgi:predicted nucleic acid-binding protein